VSEEGCVCAASARLYELAVHMGMTDADTSTPDEQEGTLRHIFDAMREEILRLGDRAAGHWRCQECGLTWKDGRQECTHSVKVGERELVEFPE
jgi:hypothetical protein